MMGLPTGEHDMDSNAREGCYLERASHRSIRTGRRDGQPGAMDWPKMLASDAQFDSATYVQQDLRGERLSACNKRLGSNVLTRSFSYWRHLSIA